eukprot:378543-Rhodomonas_salina.3
MPCQYRTPPRTYAMSVPHIAQHSQKGLCCASTGHLKAKPHSHTLCQYHTSPSTIQACATQVSTGHHPARA